MIYAAEIERRTIMVFTQANWDKMPDFAKQAYLDDPYCEVEVV
jgi:hypothetical protein|tara:strand:- start:47 stop:175 length:129 start_codon:yes stop_codon:yes gene_type:complete